MPKFDSPPWYIAAAIGSTLIIIDAVLSLILKFEEPFFPWQAGRIFRLLVGIALDVHVLDLLINGKEAQGRIPGLRDKWGEKKVTTEKTQKPGR